MTGEKICAMHCALLFAVLTSLTLFRFCDAELNVVRDDGSLEPGFHTKSILLNYGEEYATVNVLYHGDKKVKNAVVRSVDNSHSGLWEAGNVVTRTGQGSRRGYRGYRGDHSHRYNHSLPFHYSQGVGTGRWALDVELETGEREVVQGRFIVAGLVLKQEGSIVSGIGRKGVRLGTYEDILSNSSLLLDVEAVGVDGSVITDLKDLDVRVKDTSGIDMKQVEETRITDDGKLLIRFAPYRVGSGKLVADINFPGIEMDGEEFETVLHMEFDTSSVPPPVVVGGSSSVSEDGIVSMKAFNLLHSQARFSAKECVLDVGGKKILHDPIKSKFVQPDQLLVFNAEGMSGPATVSCDGRSAVVLNRNSKSSQLVL